MCLLMEYASRAQYLMYWHAILKWVSHYASQVTGKMGIVVLPVDSFASRAQAQRIVWLVRMDFGLRSVQEPIARPVQLDAKLVVQRLSVQIVL